MKDVGHQEFVFLTDLMIPLALLLFVYFRYFKVKNNLQFLLNLIIRPSGGLNNELPQVKWAPDNPYSRTGPRGYIFGVIKSNKN